MSLDYRPGSQFLVALPGLTFLTPDEQLARRVWATVGTTGQVDDLLVELVRDVTDRHSTNGVVVVSAGVDLACVPGVPTPVPDGSTVRFGDRSLVIRRS